MKQTFLHLILFFCIFAAFNPASAQIVIHENNFPRPPVYTDSLYYAQFSNLPAASEGSEQTWDYSTLQKDFVAYTEHFDGSNDPDIPGATGYYESNLFFQFFVIPGISYEAVDSEGWTLKGHKSEETIEDISFITGGAGDLLTFPAANRVFNDRIDWVKFPASYGDQWASTRIDTVGFELTVAAFGLNGTPGARTQTITDTREVVGSGNLIIPRADGTPSEPMDVLLMKGTVTTVDSIFLAGAPAPQALMDAFFLEQGASSSFEGYFFYKPGFGSSVLFYSAGNPGFYQYRPQGDDAISSVKDLVISNMNSFPNPISRGQMLTIETEHNISEGMIHLFDLQGRLGHTTKLEPGMGTFLQIQIPYDLETSMYVYQIRDSEGQLIGFEKIQVVE